MAGKYWPVFAALLGAAALAVALAPSSMTMTLLAVPAVVAGGFAGAARRRGPRGLEPPIAVFATAELTALASGAPDIRTATGAPLALRPEETFPVLRRKASAERADCVVLGTTETGERVCFTIRILAEQFERAERITDPETHRTLAKAFFDARVVIGPELTTPK
ncbi:hypothetical protein ACIQF6_10385 [Kitasatospora sp. NPDC092948]|uniref:hypothetical protein n=1 Tax=Kitasatospora sp. NPDC092948 TaxID=3364088 RepID=UPI0037F24AB7